MYEDNNVDIAFLRVASDRPPLSVDPDFVFKKGQTIFTIGNPGVGTEQGFLQNAVSRGIISTKASHRGVEYFQLGISVNSGNSGGPVINERGKVVGMVTLKFRTVEGVAFSIPPDQIMSLYTKALRQSPEELAALGDKHNKGIGILEIIEAFGLR